MEEEEEAEVARVVFATGDAAVEGAHEEEEEEFVYEGEEEEEELTQVACANIRSSREARAC